MIQRQREELQRIRKEVEEKRSVIESSISNGKHILLREQSSLSDSSDASSDGALTLCFSLGSPHSLPPSFLSFLVSVT